MIVTFTTRGERDAETKVSVDFFSLSKDDRSSHWSSLINCGNTSLDFQSDKDTIKLFLIKFL